MNLYFSLPSWPPGLKSRDWTFLQKVSTSPLIPPPTEPLSANRPLKTDQRPTPNAQLSQLSPPCVCFCAPSPPHPSPSNPNNCAREMGRLPSLKLTFSHLSMDGLEYDHFLLGFSLFSRAFAVSFREGNFHEFFLCQFVVSSSSRVFFKTAKPVDNAAAPIALAANIRRHPGLFVHAQRA